MQDKKLRKLLGVPNLGPGNGDAERFVKGELPVIRASVNRLQKERLVFARAVNEEFPQIKENLSQLQCEMLTLRADMRGCRADLKKLAERAGHFSLVNLESELTDGAGEINSDKDYRRDPRDMFGWNKVSSCCTAPEGFCSGSLAGKVKAEVQKKLTKDGTPYNSDNVIIALCDMVITRDMMLKYDKELSPGLPVGQDIPKKEGDSSSQD